MAWQQRSTGNRYASPSVHALFVGGVTRRPIALQIKCKLCNYCKWWKKKHPPIDGEEKLPPLPHTCYANHQGSSGSMEPKACLDLTIMMYKKFKCGIDLICVDDDASTRSLMKWSKMKWSNADNMKNNNTPKPPTVAIGKGKNAGAAKVRPDYGKLPGNIPEPKFLIIKGRSSLVN
jgi:hypothetical protein